MNFNLPAGRLARHAWEDRPIRFETRDERDVRMKPWWQSGMIDEESRALRKDHVSHFGDLAATEDSAVELMRGIDFEGYRKMAIATEHEFALEAHAARVENTIKMKKTLRINDKNRSGVSVGGDENNVGGRFLTPTMYGTTPSTRVPMEAYLKTLAEVEARNKRRLHAINEREGRLPSQQQAFKNL